MKLVGVIAVWDFLELPCYEIPQNCCGMTFLGIAVVWDCCGMDCCCMRFLGTAVIWVFLESLQYEIFWNYFSMRFLGVAAVWDFLEIIWYEISVNCCGIEFL